MPYGPLPQEMQSASPQAWGLAGRPTGLGEWVMTLALSPLLGYRSGAMGPAAVTTPESPQLTGAASRHAQGLCGQGMPLAQLTRPGGVRQVVVGRCPGKLPQFPAAQAQHPGYRRLLQRSIKGAAPRDRACTRACPGAWAAVNTRKVTSGRYRARVVCSRGHSDQPCGRHFSADNALTRRLSACATRTDGWAGKGAYRPRTVPLMGRAAVPLSTSQRLPPPTRFFKGK